MTTNNKSSMHGEASIHINAPVEAVYALVSDVTRMGEWSPECYRCEWVNGARGPKVGAQFRGYNKAGWLRWSRLVEITTADPGREFAFTTLQDFVNKDSSLWTYRFEHDAGGTRVIESYEVLKIPSLPIRALGALAGRPYDKDLTPDMEQTLRRLKATAESLDSR